MPVQRLQPLLLLLILALALACNAQNRLKQILESGSSGSMES
jgi:hypothetical protein